MTEFKGKVQPSRPGLVLWHPQPDDPYDDKYPLKYSREFHSSLVSLLQAGHTLPAASNALGITPQTVQRWVEIGQNDRSCLHQFALDVQRSMARGILSLERPVLQKAIGDAENPGDADLALKVLTGRSRAWNKDSNAALESAFAKVIQALGEALPQEQYEQVCGIIARALGGGGSEEV